MAEKNGRGLDRREFLRRSAIVGGTVAWMTPVIQSLAPPAFAHSVSPTEDCCCQCRATGSGQQSNCSTSSTATASQAACEEFCGDGNTAELHCGPSTFSCSDTGQNNNLCTVTDGDPHVPAP